MAREMGSGWEANIAKLIEKANETLAGSAQSRSRNYCSFIDRGGSGRSCGGVPPSSSRSRAAFSLSSAPKTFRGERSASYRCGTGGWDTSLLGDRSRVPLPRPDGFPSNLPQAPARFSSFSRLAETRVNDARIVGMEDRIKLEVQTLVRSDVDQRVSLGERATESLRKHVNEVAEEISRLGGTVFELNAGARSQKDTLEQVLADSKRNRTSLGVLEKWQQDRTAWFARADGTLSSLAEDNQTLARCAHTQQKVMEEASATHKDLTVAMTRVRKAAEAATASALAPVREHFLEEVKSIQKRLLEVEGEAKAPVIPALTRTEVKSIAQEIESAEAKELWTRMETHMQGTVEDCTRKPCGSVGSRFAEKKRHASGPSSILLAAIRRKSILRRAGRRADSSHSLPEAREVSVAPTSEVSRLRCTVSELQQRLDNALERMEESLQGELRQNRLIVEREASKPSLDDLVLSAKDHDARIKRLEELELRRKPQSPDGPAKAGAVSLVWADKMENVFERVQALESGEALAIKRQASADNRIEEMNEQLCGHSLKFRCLDGLWREAGCANRDNKLAVESLGRGSGDSGGHSNGEGISSTSAQHVDVCPLDGEQGQQQHQQVQQDSQEHCADEQLHHAVSTGREEQVSASTKTLRSGLSSFLKRLGSSATLSTSSQGHGKAKTGERHGVEERAQTQSLIATARDAEKVSSRPLHERSTADAHVVSRVGKNAGSAEQIEGNTVVSGVVSKSSEETKVQPEALGQDTRDTNTESYSQLAETGSKDPSVIDVDQHRPTRNRPGIEDDGTLHTPSGRGGREKNLHGDAECDTHPNKKILLHESDPTSAASEGGATEDHGQKLHVEESEIRRHGDVCGAATSSNTRADSPFPAAITTPGVEALVALQDDQNHGVHDEKGLQDSVSVDGSVRSRWSLPDTAPLGLAGLHEQRAIWAEGSSEDDSIDTCDQILSSESEERQRDSKSSRSRVESYDLPREMDDGYNTPPFSPSVASIQSEPPASSSQAIDPGVETISGSQGTSLRHSTGDPKIPGDDVKAERALSADSSASAAFAPATPEPVRVGVADIRVSVERTERPARGGDSVADCRSLASPSGAIEETETIFNQSGDARISGQEERVRGFSSNDIDDDDKASWDSDSLTSDSSERRPRDRITPPDPSIYHNLDDDERGEESKALPGASNTAPGTWAAPDFGFSSDEEGDLLDFRKPVPELSSSGVVEEARGNATPPPPPSSCLTRGIIDEFDSSSSSNSSTES